MFQQIPTLRIHNAHPQKSNPWRSQNTVQTRSSLKKIIEAHASKALEDGRWLKLSRRTVAVQASTRMWFWLIYPIVQRLIVLNWVYITKKDERGSSCQNKQVGSSKSRQEERGIDYDEVFAPVVYKVVKAFVWIGKPKPLELGNATLSTILAKQGYKRATLPRLYTIEETKRNPVGSSVTPKTSHLNAVKRTTSTSRANQTWIMVSSVVHPLDLEAFFFVTMVVSNLDRKSTTAASNSCGQCIVGQNQLLDYGFNFMNTTIHIDNKAQSHVKNTESSILRPNTIEIRHRTSSGIVYDKKLTVWRKSHRCKCC
ncbi:hypothetical protein Tco_1516225 [Tanacetum coccineum]